MMPTTVSMAMLMKQVKGVSSSLLRDLFPNLRFQWAQGYGVFAVSRSHLPRVIAYVENQKTRHAQKLLWDEWEERRITLSTPESEAPASEGRSAPRP